MYEKSGKILNNDKYKKDSIKFEIVQCNLPGENQNLDIISVDVTKKYIYLLADNDHLFYLESKTLKPIQISFLINTSDTYKVNRLEEDFSKIWADRAGNHCIIRHKKKIYYFNILYNKVEELESFNNIEICAIGFDDKKEDPMCTGLFLASDNNNNIYECKINLQNKNGGYKLVEYLKKLTTLYLDDSEDDDEDFDYGYKKRKINDRIYGIKFVRAKKENNNFLEKNNCYFIFTTKNRLYQFRSSDATENTFKFCFMKYDRNKMLFNDIRICFPEKSGFTKSHFNILFGENDNVEQFGWKTDSGFCLGNFKFCGFLPELIENFTIIPYERLNKYGKKIKEEEPISVAHTKNHIFFLYYNYLTIISKVNNRIIYNEDLSRFAHGFKGLVYNEFAEDNGVILLYHRYGLYKISLKEENRDIWIDYLDIGERKYTPDDDNLGRIINRLMAEQYFAKKDYICSIGNYIYSDEIFEIVLLKFLMEGDCNISHIHHLLELYIMKENKEELKFALLLILYMETILNNPKIELKKFGEIIRDKKYNKAKKIKNIIYSLAKGYGKFEEFIEYASVIGDYESVILYYINQLNIIEALNKLNTFSTFNDSFEKEDFDILGKIFLDNCHFFFKYPEVSIKVINRIFKNIPLKEITQKLIYEESKYSYNNDALLKNEVVINFMNDLIFNKNIKEDIYLNNAFLYYMSKSPINQKLLIEFLKGLFRYKDSINNLLNLNLEKIYL